MFKFGSDYQSDDENEIEIHFVDLSSDEDESDQEIRQEIGLESGWDIKLGFMWTENSFREFSRELWTTIFDLD